MSGETERVPGATALRRGASDFAVGVRFRAHLSVDTPCARTNRYPLVSVTLTVRFWGDLRFGRCGCRVGGLEPKGRWLARGGADNGEPTSRSPVPGRVHLFQQGSPPSPPWCVRPGTSFPLPPSCSSLIQLLPLRLSGHRLGAVFQEGGRMDPSATARGARWTSRHRRGPANGFQRKKSRNASGRSLAA